VLVLPLDDYYQMPTTWGFSGVDSISGLLVRHPVLQRHPDGYFGDTPGTAAQIDAVEQALLAGDLTSVPSLLSSLGVSTVIVRHDLITGMPGRTFADGTVLAAAVARLPGSTRVVEGPLDIWRLADSGATVSTASAPLTVPGDPAALAATVAMTPAGQAVVGDPTTPKPVAPSALPRAWPPQPTACGGRSRPSISTPSTTFTTSGVVHGGPGGWAAHSCPGRWPTHRDERRRRAAGPATVLLDGQAVSQRPPGRAALDGPVVAVQAGNPRPARRWLAPSLPAGSSAGSGAVATVPVGAATPLTAWARAAEQPTHPRHPGLRLQQLRAPPDGRARAGRDQLRQRRAGRRAPHRPGPCGLRRP
jgi:arabinofuranan 3-O-arabinosyltransferase